MHRPISLTPDFFAGLVIRALALGLFGLMLLLIVDLIGPGFSTFSWSFLFESPLDSGRGGGISTILVSTLLILGVSIIVALPIGLAMAIWLAEFVPVQDGYGRFVRMCLDICAGVPSIVFGLFGNALFCRYLGMGFSILSGGLTLACMILPVIVRTAEIGFRSAPKDFRFSGQALALSRITILWQLTFPAALPAIAAGLLLSIGRAVAETAALIFTSGYVSRMPESLHDSGRSLSIHIYDLTMNVPGGEQNAYTSVFVILGVLLVINALTMLLANRWRAARLDFI